MVEADGAFFRTTDMTLAAVLACQGYTYRVERLNSRSGAWVFNEPKNDEDFDDLVEEYKEASVRVEPKAFAAELAAVRKRMYNLLGVQPNAKTRLTAPSADQH